jgi:hypothetical protein
MSGSDRGATGGHQLLSRNLKVALITIAILVVAFLRYSLPASSTGEEIAFPP